MIPGEYTQKEIATQPAVWQATLAAYPEQAGRLTAALARLEPKHFTVIGCGSTYFLSLSAAAILRNFGLRAVARPASEQVYFPEPAQGAGALLVAISRSGITSETLWAVESFRRQHPASLVVAITTVPDSTLARTADVSLVAEAAQEKSMAQTRSFTSMYLLAQALAGTLAHDAGYLERLGLLPGALRQLVERAGDLPRRLGEDLSIERIFYLAGGPLHGLACEAMLKTKEMSCSWSEAFHPLEFRHGPISVVDAASLVVGFVSTSGAQAEAGVLRDVRELRAKTLVLTGSAAPAWEGMDHVVELGCDLNDWQRGALYLPLIQQMAYHRSLAKGLDPDRPRNLSAVIELSPQGIP